MRTALQARFAHILTCSLALVIAPAFLYAEPRDDHAPAAHGAAASHDSHAAAESPSILSGDLGNVFWTAVIFVTLVIVLRAVAWKPILTALQKREHFIADSLNSAKKEREEAARLLADYKTKLDKSHQEATAIVEEGRRDAEETRKRIHGEAKAEADAIVMRAKKDIELARDEAVKRVHDLSIQLATTMAGKLIRRELTPSDQQTLLNESLSELGKLN